jgi:3-deoxy-7-phosphoheptulonate synthase
MIVVMKPGASQQQIDHIVDLIEGLELRSHIIVGTDRTVVAALGEKRDGAKQALEAGEGVEKVMPILAPYKMASTEVKQDPTCVVARQLKVGAGNIGVIAGPCSVESRAQILDVAHAVRAAGAQGLRGGAFKPRTSPYSFQGQGFQGQGSLSLSSLYVETCPPFLY